MINYIIKRLVASIITLFVVITATFFLMHALPGGPFDSEKPLPPQIKANLEAKYGLDKPIHQQYVMYLKNLSRGELGPTLKYEGKTVNEIIKYSFPASAKLGVVSIIFSLILGIYLGVVAALNQGKWQDSFVMVLATLGVTVPSFVLAILLMYVFAVKLKVLPPTGFSGPKYMIMPALALSGYSLSFIARLTRSSLLDVIRQDYIRTAKAKGLSKNVVIYKHALRNALIPVVTYLGPLVAGILTGSFVIEKIFAIPGLGREFVTSITNRDYMMIMGITVFYSTLLVICNLIVDLLYAVIDPRIKLEA
ncbi:ABC transporter permease [Thermobrachium celere]|uniref:Oligopeptide transport system permease protein OppB (TC 3.A.1.5.1) n=1 Tax=Thermobrachium celere DSM 8682 TaxID=941824 RepID=R7RV25_9CLOT|nr:ABC transporter permease [Thermobrachium celere]GFR36088.1 peptide ABC transporter permease [Thermobrachium celere]CDF59461.1 Oligopeptide transport system permease protein OppB (TC 3.A.1.5.1) [Thermobrachium celere DSM 8682]